jgi:hypothetical protein
VSGILRRLNEWEVVLLGREAAIAITNLGTEKAGDGNVFVFMVARCRGMKTALALGRDLSTNSYRSRSPRRQLSMVFKYVCSYGVSSQPQSNHSDR